MMHLSVVLRPGSYVRSAWRLDGDAIERGTQLSTYQELALAAERAHLDAVFCADALNLTTDPWDRLSQPLEPQVLLAALAGLTSKIGLIATASTTYNEPYMLARQLATLDHVSAGRAGWNVVTTADPAAAANFGLDQHPDHALRYQRADEFVDVMKQLWASWKDGAIDIDRAAGRQTNDDLIQPIDFEGRFFTVKGPLNVPPSPQRRPVLVHAGQSEDGLPVAARHAEVLFGVQFDLETAKAFYADLMSRVVAAGRNPDHLSVLPGLVPIIGSTQAEAEALFDELRALGGTDDKINDLSRLVDYDISAVDLDDELDLGKMKPVHGNLGPQSWDHLIYTTLRSRPMSVRQAIELFQTVGRSGHLQVVGTPEKVADVMERWYREKACDGFNVMPGPVPQGAMDFFEQVVPILAERGVFRSDYEGDTLRDHFGLPPVL